MSTDLQSKRIYGYHGDKHLSYLKDGGENQLA